MALVSSPPISSPGLVVVEHRLTVPLDHADPGGEQITVFAREVADTGGRDRPILVYLQGGPGNEAPRPTRHPTSPGWLDRALTEFRVLMLDQRGTGLSSPVGTLPGLTPQQQARHLSLLRADSIVADAEAFRQALGVDRWSVLGQSFGGFCALAYLSQAPGGLREAFFTGGLPPIGRHPDEVYAATYERMVERNARYYARYPGDRERVVALQRTLAEDDVRLPGGDRLTVPLLRQLGALLGMSDGAEHLHHLIERPHDSPGFGHDVEASLPFGPRNPLYTVLHESCYADGTTTGWSAARTMPVDFETSPELFTGEHVYPWLLDAYAAYAPMADAGHLLADHPWPRLYDPQQLARNEVPASAAVYVDDPYVEHRFSMETAAAVKGLRPWVTNEYDHNGLRADGGRILDRLIDLARGRA